MLIASVQQKVINYCQNKGYKLSEEDGTYNIIYIEGMNLDGSPNDDSPNSFNDIRSVWNHKLECLAVWAATTEPGDYYTYNPMNRKGAARIAFGQYEAWSVGLHGGGQPHEGLIQVSPISVCRDFNKDFLRVGDNIEKGLFGINQHWGYNLEKVGKASGGCLVGRTKEGHKEFMSLAKSDVRYQSNSKFVFSTTIIPGDKL